MAEHLKQILEYATSQGYKANAIKPILGGLVIVLLIIVSGLYFKSQIVVLSGIVLLGIFVLAFLIAYFICLTRNPDLLRSERYNLEKAAIEKATIKGDSTIHGHLKAPDIDYLVIEGGNAPHKELTSDKIE